MIRNTKELIRGILKPKLLVWLGEITYSESLGECINRIWNSSIYIRRQRTSTSVEVWIGSACLVLDWGKLLEIGKIKEVSSFSNLETL